MRLFITPTSPYGRIARIVVHEKGLTERVTVIEARTRTPDSPYYQVVPSGRVPYLERDDGPGLEDSQLICRYLDQLSGHLRLHLLPETDNWAYGRLEATARSLLDGLAVHLREMRRPEHERSPTIIAHEAARAARMARQWNGWVAEPLMGGDLNMAQIILYVALDRAVTSRMHDWRPDCPQLRAWFEALSQRPSIAATAGPPTSG